ncbi:MAG: hypothetical protein AAGI38_00455 [Bacteroidota bacterium]
MQSSFKLLLGSLILFHVQTGWTQTIWNGPPIIFEKADSTDWLLPENQDRITDSVWITRQFRKGIFNIRKEQEFDRLSRLSPLGTEWANGKISDGIENLSFTTWDGTKSGQSSMEVGVNKVLHLVAEDIYLDVKFLSWTAGGGGSGTGFGGGFSYQRSTPLVSSREEKTIYPYARVIHQDRYLKVTCSEPLDRIKVISLSGKVVSEFHPDLPVQTHTLSTSDFPEGLYLIIINGKFSIKFVKS